MSQDERPRWTFTWLLRVQRTGRNRDAKPHDGVPLGRMILIAVVGAIILLELGVAVWLGLDLGHVLGRP